VIHWGKKEKSQKLTTGERNFVHDPLVDAAKLFSPPLHIKLGLAKNSVKAVLYICSRNSPA
jgi:hypothetical protein